MPKPETRNRVKSGELTGERWMHRTSAREVGVLITLAILAGLVSGVSAVGLSLAVHKAILWAVQWQGTIWMILLPAVGAAMSARAKSGDPALASTSAADSSSL